MEGWKGTKGYRQIIRDEQPNTGRVHQMEPDGPLHHPVGATNQPLSVSVSKHQPNDMETIKIVMDLTRNGMGHIHIGNSHKLGTHSQYIVQHSPLLFGVQPS
jgi:hypothetical protein